MPGPTSLPCRFVSIYPLLNLDVSAEQPVGLKDKCNKKNNNILVGCCTRADPHTGVQAHFLLHLGDPQAVVMSLVRPKSEQNAWR